MRSHVSPWPLLSSVIRTRIMERMKKLATVPLLAGAMLAGGALAGYASFASAQTTTTTTSTENIMHARMPHVDGTITAINGSTITITADANHGGGTYTIDASNATFMKAGATATISDFAVGENVWAMGTVSDNTVVATNVSDGSRMGKGFGFGHGREHGVMGTVASVNGTTITVNGKDGQTYTVDAGNATVHKMITTTVSDIAVGDTVGVQGTISGTSVSATDIASGIPTPPDRQ